ncbi:MAG: DNA repair protein RecO [Chloroflexota bacterium]|nr:DNA repair protein RecO [Chloroflexota bacterium]
MSLILAAIVCVGEVRRVKVGRIRSYRTEAIVLRRRDFFEADRLLAIYTPKFGKIWAIAKGIRKPTSRKSGHLELFTHSQLLIAKGRELDIITQAETIHAFLPLREDLLRTTYAYYIAELLDKFVEEGVEDRSLFDLLLATLGRLGEENDLALTARFFELRLLALVGYRPQLFRCVECGANIGLDGNFFSPAKGGVLCPRCGEGETGTEGISAGALKVLRFLQTRDYDLCRKVHPSPELHADLEALVQRYIVYILERNLKSAKFLWRLRREIGIHAEGTR